MTPKGKNAYSPGAVEFANILHEAAVDRNQSPVGAIKRWINIQTLKQSDVTHLEASSHLSQPVRPTVEPDKEKVTRRVRADELRMNVVDTSTGGRSSLDLVFSVRVFQAGREERFV